LQESLKHRIVWIARGQSFHVTARLLLEDGTTRRIARGFAHQGRGEHPGTLDLRQITVVRGATHVPDSPFGVAAPQADEAREEACKGSGAREPVVVHAQPQVTVSTRRIRSQ